ncbi:hypothetical protein VSDG_04157 [Cytospora chrysosperma]|uniref:CBF1-interacting co-repressor CIR N-terminal domain-containing protein n=1 Tax=Cytospora chrysosperma TaxID=252740 RepID=A0A423W0M8_CYTCH|nr:hypothetical protein VSDG_04157 [Valsa sordida]
MPLHLLGKKSWNVYNADNIARVQRDEAAAAAAEEAAEQHMQEVDAARRLAILRGETPPPLPEAEPEIDPSDKRYTRRDRDSSGFQSKKRKRAGEDDTDFEMRLARERAEAGAKATGELATKARGGAVKEIVDKAGHIDLVGGSPEPPPSAGKNPEYEREAAKKKRELEDQFQMRFSNATGRDGFAAGAPWYAKADGRRTTADATTTTATTTVVTKEGVDAEIGMEAPSKDVWGNDDPNRKVRAVQRLNTDDPLAMMKTGAKRAREVEKERKREVEERERELKELRREERRKGITTEMKMTRGRGHIVQNTQREGMKAVGETSADVVIGTMNLDSTETVTVTGKRTGIVVVNGTNHVDRMGTTRTDIEGVKDTAMPAYFSIQGNLISTCFIFASTISAISLAPSTFSPANISSASAGLMPSFRSLYRSIPSFVNSVGANHVTAHLSVAPPSSAALSPHPRTSQWLDTKPSTPFPFQSHDPVEPCSEAAVSMPSTVLTPPLPVDFSYSTRSSRRGRAPLAVAAGARGVYVIRTLRALLHIWRVECVTVQVRCSHSSGGSVKVDGGDDDDDDEGGA